MTHLDLTELYNSSAGRGKAPHRPDLLLAIVLFELRRGQRQPSQWFQAEDKPWPWRRRALHSGHV